MTVAEIETDYSSPDIDANEELFAELKTLRREIAERENVPPYVIFSDATLMELSAYLPNSKEELSQISGFGAFKIEKYGEIFLQAILEFCRKNNVSSKISGKKPKKVREPKKAAKSTSGTFATTFELYKQNHSVEEIATLRSLSITTIQNHLSRFVESGEIEASTLMNIDKIAPIIEIAKGQTIQSLKVIKEQLGDDFSYFEIHVAIAYHKWLQKSDIIF
ncbi:HRDC domain-containing protein [Chryseobacterium caseinilyticum]|uniref:HRDC domain-containing protein n=1 Tax=Chryseobacterium caseinilyticum TaxID=2771428 RepID=UPI00293BF108|nr:HRDC domain-containing protein [Chryseobacterium caseinilyticum]